MYDHCGEGVNRAYRRAGRSGRSCDLAIKSGEACCFGKERYALASSYWQELIFADTSLSEDVDRFPICNDDRFCLLGKSITPW